MIVSEANKTNPKVGFKRASILLGEKKMIDIADAKSKKESGVSKEHFFQVIFPVVTVSISESVIKTRDPNAKRKNLLVTKNSCVVVRKKTGKRKRSAASTADLTEDIEFTV